MAKIIITDSPNGATNVRLSRQKTNEDNLREDIAAWTFISTLDDNDKNAIKNPPPLRKSKKKKSATTTSSVTHPWAYMEDPNGPIIPFIGVRTGRSRRRNKPVVNSFISNWLGTLNSRLALNASYLGPLLGFGSEDEISLVHIKKYANIYRHAPPELQIGFARNSSRQSIDEEVQIATLNKYSDGTYTVNKLSNGTLTLENGQFVHGKKKKNKKGTGARSIDLHVPSKNAYGFAKYSQPIGSSTTAITPLEVNHFIDEAKKYVNKHPDDSKKFFVLVDGKAAEEHIGEYKNLIGTKYANRISVGNCEHITSWLNSLPTVI